MVRVSTIQYALLLSVLLYYCFSEFAVQIAVGIPKPSVCLPVPPSMCSEKSNVIIPKQAVFVCSARRSSADSNGSSSSCPNTTVYGPYSKFNHKDHGITRPKNSTGSLYGPYSKRWPIILLTIYVMYILCVGEIHRYLFLIVQYSVFIKSNGSVFYWF